MTDGAVQIGREQEAQRYWGQRFIRACDVRLLGPFSTQEMREHEGVKTLAQPNGFLYSQWMPRLQVRKLAAILTII
jgi:hypothetical protein